MAHQVDAPLRRPTPDAPRAQAGRTRALPAEDAAPVYRRKRRMGRKLAVQVAVTPIYRKPDLVAEVVTQALLGAPTTVYPTPQGPDGWARVRLSDYAGWAPTTALGLPATTTRRARTADRVAVVTAPVAVVYAADMGDEKVIASTSPAGSDGGSAESAGPLVAYATTTLPLLAVGEARAQVALPGLRVGWLDLSMVAIRPVDAPNPYLGPAAAIALGQAMLGVPYLWGGVSAQGVDCSGLTQLCCRQAGVVIPRDADQQYQAIPYVVARGEVMAGDLLFFGQDGAITHVGLSLDNTHVLHASGYVGRVTVNALDPTDANYTEYSARLLAMYAGARRPLLPDTGAQIREVAIRGEPDHSA